MSDMTLDQVGKWLRDVSDETLRNHRYAMADAIESAQAELAELRAEIQRQYECIHSHARITRAAEERAQAAEAIVARLREPVSDIEIAKTYGMMVGMSGNWSKKTGAALTAHNKRILGETE